jgi:uncharacterized protein YjeT (DUF2065 family)
MQTSLFIAKLIGPLVVVAGLSALFNPQPMRDMAREFLASRALIFIAGVMALLAGLALINTHNLWVADWPVIITAFGWLAAAGGVIRIGFPALTKSIGERMMENEMRLRVIGGVQLLIGAFLSYKGYF